MLDTYLNTTFKMTTRTLKNVDNIVNKMMNPNEDGTGSSRELVMLSDSQTSREVARLKIVTLRWSESPAEKYIIIVDE